MIIPRKNGDLNVRYRPCTFSEMLGYENIINMLVGFVIKGQTPHAMLFTGPSGCGKTTAARIMALALNCFDSKIWQINGVYLRSAVHQLRSLELQNVRKAPMEVQYDHANPCCKCSSCKSILNLNSMSVQELDGARTSDVNTVRDIIKSLPSAPMSGERYKILILDEAHNLSGKAEDALLKFLEDTPEHVYIILCTNEPQKLKEVTRNRCKTIQFNRLEDKYIYQLLKEVCEYEGFDYKKNEEVIKYIVGESNGVPRQALTYLQQIGAESSWTKEAASLIINAGIDTDSITVFEFCKIILNKQNFGTALHYYNSHIKNIPAESIRIVMLGFFTGCLKNAKKYEDAKKYSAIADLLSKQYYGPKPEHILINNIFKISQILRSGNVQNNKWSSPPGFTGPRV